jgi:hypothetical protein
VHLTLEEVHISEANMPSVPMKRSPRDTDPSFMYVDEFRDEVSEWL